MVNSGIVLVGFLTIAIGFVYPFIFGNRGRGSVRTPRTSISGNPSFVLIVFGILIVCVGIVMP